MSAIEWIFQVAACVLVADFLSGLFHWCEDAYGQPHWPITGRLITQPNMLHHQNPGYFTHHSWLKSADVLILIGALLLLAAAACGVLTWQVALIVLIGINANEIHKWAHRPRARNPALVNLLHATKIIQTQAHHAEHHRGAKDTHYCVITNALNPLLDRLAFWARLERIIRKCCGAARRHDPSTGPNAVDQTNSPLDRRTAE